ncbi:hypothetical protein H7J70_11490 [Mycolicibacterium celeriflavum]|uniref:Uncharacterized protein n=1 Tax=Mycolicibacterium celeriflavum TaxID=1249101 RepID=A0A7I7RQL9_MYCCF|nr:hypothetical protein [Mycolicibacterium celeriflavum]BBY46286.1 hypothetical protein MCEL_45810 [Mycolicibacterium celeriflavum]
MDAAIKPDSVVPNDFQRFSAEHPDITPVLFNGAAAQKNFIRLVPTAPDLPHRRLPSTSPAQTMRYQDKFVTWREAITARR